MRPRRAAEPRIRARRGQQRETTGRSARSSNRSLHRDNLPGRFKTAEGPARSQDFILNAFRFRDIGLFVADSEGQLVGLVHAIMRDLPDIPILAPRRCGVVDNLAVRKSVRRAGVGRALMARGVTAMELTVHAFNQVAKVLSKAGI